MGGKKTVCFNPHRNVKRQNDTMYVNALWNVERVHRMLCIFFTACLRNLFIYSESICWGSVATRPPSGIHSCAHAHGQCFPLSTLLHSHRASDSQLLQITEFSTTAPPNTRHSLRLNLCTMWKMLSNHSHECLSYFVLKHSQWHKPQTLYFLC